MQKREPRQERQLENDQFGPIISSREGRRLPGDERVDDRLCDDQERSPIAGGRDRYAATSRVLVENLR